MERRRGTADELGWLIGNSHLPLRQEVLN